jgi:hypothetical protein
LRRCRKIVMLIAEASGKSNTYHAKIDLMS